MNDDSISGTLGRRSAVKLLGTAATAGVVAASGLAMVAEPAVSATTSLSAGNVTLTSNAGQLQSLYVQPDMEYEWNGLDNEPDRVDFFVEARLPNGPATSFEQIGTEGETISSTALESSAVQTYSFQNQVSILSHSGISSNGSDFEDTGEGWTKDTTVEVQVRTELTDVAGTTYSDTSGDTFTVTLTNEQGDVNGGGSANPGGSAR